MSKGIAPFAMSREARGVAWTCAVFLLIGAVLISSQASSRMTTVRAPTTLQETGLYSDFAALEVDPRHLAFSPQYPLWTDGATKRRWISLPPGTAIDGLDPDAWVFPVGTRLWKEFAFNGRRVETRYLERMADGEWLYAAYEWSADGRDARLAPERGRRNAYPLAGGRSHTIPGLVDCAVCHRGGGSEVLGFSALQLSPDRDPGALHSGDSFGAHVDLDFLIDNGLLVGMPGSLQETPPRIAARSAVERAALGYLHGNCGHCHNDQGSLHNIGLYLRQRFGPDAPVSIETAAGHPVRKLAPGQPAGTVLRIDPGHPEQSSIVQRVASRYPALQMPPLGTELADSEAVSLLRRWVAEMEEQKSDVAQQGGGK